MSLAFSPAAEEKIAQLLTRYPTRMAACLPVLWIAQQEFGGWLSQEAQDLVAARLNLPPSHIYGVVTFYTMYNRKPVGKFHIQVCTNTSCQLSAAKETVAAFERKLGIRCGETTADGWFTLQETECLAACSTAPAVQINDRYMEPVTAQDVAVLVDALRSVGNQPANSEAVRIPAVGKWEGVVGFNERRAPDPAEVPSAPREKRVKIVTQNFGDEQAKDIDAYERLGGYANLRRALRLTPDEIIDQVKQSNLRGRGGAGFPTGTKWSFIPKEAATTYLVINADESEPGTFKDRWLMYWDPHRLIEGACITAHAIRAKTVYLYLRGELASIAKILQRAIDQAYRRGYLGPSMAGSGRPLDLYLHSGAGAYICGEETALLESLEGKRGWPRLKPPFPAVKGLFAQPTVVNNVETIMNIPTIIEKGPKWFSDLGVEKDGGTRAVAVSGHVKHPGVYEIPVGTTLRDIIYTYAGGMRGNKALKAVIPGGTSMPVMSADEIDVPYSNDGLMKSPKIKELEIQPGQLFQWAGGTLRTMPGSGAVIVMEEGTDMVEVCARIMHFYAHESCGQCTPCREGTGWLARVCDRLEHHHGEAGDAHLLAHVANGIGGNTICALGDAAAWPMLAFLTKFRAEFEARAARSTPRRRESITQRPTQTQDLQFNVHDAQTVRETQ